MLSQSQAVMQSQLQSVVTSLAALRAQQRLFVADSAGVGGVSLWEKFRRSELPSFKGERDSVAAEVWIREMEKVFRLVRCPAEDMVNLATFALRDEADSWWACALRVVFKQKEVIPWNDFLVAFRERFTEEHRVGKRKQVPSSVVTSPAVGQATVSSADTVADQEVEYPICRQCRRRHGGAVCWKASGWCFRCGAVGHLRRECPKLESWVTGLPESRQ